jgi:hypothetical protein
MSKGNKTHDIARELLSKDLLPNSQVVPYNQLWLWIPYCSF